VVAFDEGAYPEFFKSELWTLVGPFAFCDRSFEIEPDCNYVEAFLAMAREAVEGSIDLREGTEKKYVRIHKLGRPINRWWKTPMDAHLSAFAAEVEKHVQEWAPLVEKAKSADSEKAAKEARKAEKSAGRSRVVELPANPSRVLRLADGSFAVAAGTKIVFVAPSGEIMGTTECRTGEYDMFEMGITGLGELRDGRVVASQELAHEVRIARRGEERATTWKCPEGVRSTSIKGAIGLGDGLAVHGICEAFIVSSSGETKHVIAPWGKDDFVSGVLAWGRGLLVWKSDETVAYDESGRELFRAKGTDPLVVDSGGLVLRRDQDVVVLGDDGKEERVLATGDVTWNHDELGYTRAWHLEGDDLLVATSLPNTLARWNVRTGERVWHATKVQTAKPDIVVRAKAFAVTCAPPPFFRDKDTTLGVFDLQTGAEAARLDAKAPLLGAIALGEGVAAWLEGRTAGTKIIVWRKLEPGARSETLAGHKGRVRGLAELDGGRRLLSWAADKTLRIWER
jgi:hypothetical protein